MGEEGREGGEEGWEPIEEARDMRYAVVSLNRDDAVMRANIEEELGSVSSGSLASLVA